MISRSKKLRIQLSQRGYERLCDTLILFISDVGRQMYQFTYHWVTPDMFTLHLPSNNTACKDIDNAIIHEAEFCMQGDDALKNLYKNSAAVIKPEIEAHHTKNDIDDNIYKAAQKFVQYTQKRDTVVTFHGPNTCSVKKPWAAYTHFHVTVIANHRPGTDTTYNNLVALHRKVATCHIPASQITRFPASWANYLAQYPRIPW